MKMFYWDPLLYRNRPHVLPPSLIRIKGFYHDSSTLREIVWGASLFPQHTFLLNFTRASDVYGLPENILPVMHYSDDREVDDDFRECLENQEIKIVSLFCHVPLSPVKAHWTFISGNNFKNVKETSSKVQGPTYFEYFQGSKIVKSFPKMFRVRLIPKKVVFKVIEKCLS